MEFRAEGNWRNITRVTDQYQQIIDTLSKCKRVLVTTHVRPDGDALGTCAAMVLGMKKVGIDAEVLLLSHLPAGTRWQARRI